MTLNPIAQDIPRNKDYPAKTRGIHLYSHGSRLNGVLYSPSGQGRHPLVVLLHGLPGDERNLDLGQILRRAGWHVAIVHYRGSWGSEGAYQFSHVLEDVKSILDHLKEEDIATEYGIDTGRIVTIGHSLGGWAALMAGINGWVQQTASLAGANFGTWGQLLDEAPVMVRPMIEGIFEESRGPLSNWDTDAQIQELIVNQSTWDLTARGQDLAGKSVLLVGAKYDEVLPVFDYHVPQVDAYRAIEAIQLTHTILDTDHSFADARIALAQTLLNWLATE